MRNYLVDCLHALRHHLIRRPLAALGAFGHAFKRQCSLPTHAARRTGWDDPTHLDRMAVAQAAHRIAGEFTSLPQNLVSPVLAEVMHLLGKRPTQIEAASFRIETRSQNGVHA